MTTHSLKRAVTRRSGRTMVLLLGIFGQTLLFAQSSGALPAPAPAASKDTRVVMTPFEVVAEEDGSYQATRTLAGTRFNTELKNVPASLSVMTADFLRDIDALNVNQALEFAIGSEPDREDTTGNNFQGNDVNLRMRGFRNSSLGRNFFQSGISADNYNTERITFARGPNAVIFGTGGAGGIVDASTKRAGQRPITSLTTRIGSYDDYRVEVDVGRPLSETLSLRLNTL